MASQHRKRRGYESQRIVARYLRRWWPYAEATGAGLQGSDLTGTPGLVWEIKARRELDLTGSMRQAAGHLSGGRYAPVVVRPDGWGEARIADWPTILPLWAVAELLVAAGYGSFNGADPIPHHLKPTDRPEVTA